MKQATQISINIGYDPKSWQIGFWWGNTERGPNRLVGKQVTIMFLCFALRIDVVEVFV